MLFRMRVPAVPHAGATVCAVLYCLRSSRLGRTVGDEKIPRYLDSCQMIDIWSNLSQFLVLYLFVLSSERAFFTMSGGRFDSA